MRIGGTLMMDKELTDEEAEVSQWALGTLGISTSSLTIRGITRLVLSITTITTTLKASSREEGSLHLTTRPTVKIKATGRDSKSLCRMVSLRLTIGRCRTMDIGINTRISNTMTRTTTMKATTLVLIKRNT